MFTIRRLTCDKFKRKLTHFYYGSIKERLFRNKINWDLTDSQIKNALQMMIDDKAINYVASENLLSLFLYAKGIMGDQDSQVRVLKFRQLLNIENEIVSQQFKKKMTIAKERLVRIVEKNENSSDFTFKSDNYFQRFVKDHPEWNSSNSFVIFRDHPSLARKDHGYVERFQSSGLCYMHAPVVLQHYLVCMNSKEHVPMLDMTAYLREIMDSKSLERHIWDDEGGDSKVFLKNLLSSGNHTEFTTVYAHSKNIPELIEKFGPALIQGFQVDRDFHSSKTQHLGSREINPIGRHAMVLVGYRKENDKFRYLAQNWWKMKPFVEFDSDYLKSCDPALHFIETPQIEMRSFKLNFHDHAECELLDSPEKLCSN